MNSSVGRFSPNPFKYNERVAAVLVPSLIVLCGLAGKAVAGILLAGAMFTYIMDALRWKEASLASVWITLIGANIGFIVSNILQSNKSISLVLGSAAINGVTLMLVGIWSTLQFKSMLLKDPQLVLSAERILFASALPVGMIVLTLGASTAIGMSRTPFFSMVIGCILYTLLMRPMPSSFQRITPGPGIGGANVGSLQIQGYFEGISSAVVICLFPSLLYLASHWEVAFESEHFCSIHLLWTVPALFLCFLPNGFWWISEQIILRDYARSAIVIVCGIIALAAFEGRVIFYSFGSYIPLYAPWNWIIVSIFLFSNAFVLGAHFAGWLSTQIGFTVGSAILICASCAGGIAAGLPLALMPAPLIGSAGLALFYDSRLLRDYFVFVVGSSVTVFWLLWHHYWFLEIQVGSFSLQAICQLIGVSFMVALILPGLAFSEVEDFFIKLGRQGFLLIQAIALTALEEQLYGGEHDEEAVLYPAYLVLATSIAGIYLTRNLEKRGLISDAISWILQCIYVSNLPMLLLPESSLVLPSFCLIAAISPPILLMKPAVGSSHSRDQLPWWKGSLLATTVVCTVLFSRMAIFDIVQALVSSRPPEGFLLGTLFLLAALGCLPLIFRFYSNSSSVRRAFILTVAFGSLVCILRPPFPIRGMAKCPNLPAGLCPRLWDERHIPLHEMEDLEMYGLGLARREHWPLWLLVIAVMTGLTAVTSPTPLQKSIQSRLLWGSLGGLSVGAYLAMEFFLYNALLQLVILTSSLLSCCFLVLLQKPSRSGPSWMVMLGALWAFCFPIALLLKAIQPVSPMLQQMRDLFPDDPSLVELEREKNEKAAILAIYVCQSLLLSFALKLKMSRTLRNASTVISPGNRPGNVWDPKIQGFGGSLTSGSASMRAFCGPGGLGAMFSAMVSPSTLDKWAGMFKMTGTGGYMIQRLSSEGLGWVPTVGNLTTVFCFLLSLWWKSYFTHGNDLVLFLITPTLLLLNQDPIFFRYLAEKRRYFPVVFALVACLTWNAFVDIVLYSLSAKDNYGISQWYSLWNFICLLMMLPSNLTFLHYLWIRQRLTNHSYALFLLPFDLMPFLRESLLSVRLLGVIGFVGCALLLIQNSRLNQAGRNLI